MQIIRGDNKTFKFIRKTGDGEVITDIPDEMYFTVKEDCRTNSPVLIQKRLSQKEINFDTETNYYQFELLPKDTDELFYKMYCYDIEIIKDNKKKTISRGNLQIEEEVTCSCNEE